MAADAAFQEQPDAAAGLGDVEIVEQTRDRPAVAARPSGTGEIVAARERPAVEPEAGVAVGEVAQMHEHLALGLGDELRPAGRDPVRREEQDDHEQRVDPELARVDLVRHQMLEAALHGARQLGHDALGPGVGGPLQRRVGRVAVQQGQGQHRRGGVDVEERQRLRQLLGVPSLRQRQLVGPARRLPGAEQPVQPDPLRPFPAVEADVVARLPSRFGSWKRPSSRRLASPAISRSSICAISARSRVRVSCIIRRRPPSLRRLLHGLRDCAILKFIA